MRSYYSYGIGQVLQQASTTPIATTSGLQTTGATSGGGTLLDAAALRHARAVVAARAAPTGISTVLPTTGMTLLAPRQPRGAHEVIQMSAAQAAAIGPKKVASAVDTGGPGAPPPGGGSMPTTADQFGKACAEAGGNVVSAMHCQLGDGSIVTVDAQGNAICANAVGKCAPGAPKKGGALVIGAAALAALMLLR